MPRLFTVATLAAHDPDEVMHAIQRPMTDLADPRLAHTIVACEQVLKRHLRTATADVFF
jgi:alanine-glyoxylate transaminase / serine-glyoxylate transaminase / serine-pyruvate transaminase